MSNSPTASEHAANGTNEETIRHNLHLFIRETFLQLRPALKISDDDDLLQLGILDSLAFVELVTEIQNRYSITVRDIDVTPENFGTVALMAKYISERSSA